jgi:hypothetical protein
MSICMQPNETLCVPLCVHGVSVKFECGICVDHHKLNLLESQIQTLTDMYKDLSIKIAAFLDYRNFQIDENRKISRRVDELQNDHAFVINGCVDRIGELERTVKAIKESYNNLCASSMKRIPYKCPICDGTGALQLETEEELNRFCKSRMRTDDNKWFIWCKSCEGKGILWG